LPDGGPALVFVTAFDQYALRAFETGACDYLLKPVEPERLARTMERLRVPSRVLVRTTARAPTRLLIADPRETQIVQIADLEWIEAADNYVTLHLAARSVLMRRTMAALLEDLGEGFLRVHRSAAIALRAVRAVRPKGKGDAVVVLESGAEVACSRQHREALLARLQGGCASLQ
jgi:two-component system LytT family response regulator